MNAGKKTSVAASIALLVVQLALVSTIAAKYLVQRSVCPRVWTRSVAVDPELPLRGRYLSLQLTVDGCESTLPSVKDAAFPRGVDGSILPGAYAIATQMPVQFPAQLVVKDDHLVAIRIPNPRTAYEGQTVVAAPGRPCDAMRLAKPVSFFLPENAASLVPLEEGVELWIEVTVPPEGPPRPIQLAVKKQGVWIPVEVK